MSRFGRPQSIPTDAQLERRRVQQMLQRNQDAPRQAPGDYFETVDATLEYTTEEGLVLAEFSFSGKFEDAASSGITTTALRPGRATRAQMRDRLGRVTTIGRITMEPLPTGDYWAARGIEDHQQADFQFHIAQSQLRRGDELHLQIHLVGAPSGNPSLG